MNFNLLFLLNSKLYQIKNFSQIQLLDMPIEILVKILSYFNKTELSIIICNTCLKLFNISQTLLKGRLTVLDNELQQLKESINNQEKPIEMVKSILDKNEVTQSVSYCAFHHTDYWTTDPRSLEATYEWLEVNQNLLDCEKVKGIGIYFVFTGISTYEIAEAVLSKCINLKQFYWYGEWPSYLENKLSNGTDIEFVSIKSPSCGPTQRADL